MSGQAESCGYQERLCYPRHDLHHKGGQAIIEDHHHVRLLTYGIVQLIDNLFFLPQLIATILILKCPGTPTPGHIAASNRIVIVSSVMGHIYGSVVLNRTKKETIQSL